MKALLRLPRLHEVIRPVEKAVRLARKAVNVLAFHDLVVGVAVADFLDISNVPFAQLVRVVPAEHIIQPSPAKGGHARVVDDQGHLPADRLRPVAHRLFGIGPQRVRQIRRRRAARALQYAQVVKTLLCKLLQSLPHLGFASNNPAVNALPPIFFTLAALSSGSSHARKTAALPAVAGDWRSEPAGRAWQQRRQARPHKRQAGLRVLFVHYGYEAGPEQRRGVENPKTAELHS